jgi:dethiobiotin synthetase
LWEAAGRPETLEAVCPQRFLAPLAPNVAAADEGRVVDETLLSTGFDFWRERSDVLLVEGAGGLLSPVSEGLLNADLAAMFGLPLVIVAANRLGVINHTLLTIQVAEQHRGKLKILGIFLNQMPGNSDTSQQSNFIQIANRVSCKNITMIGPHHKFGISTVAMHLLDLSREISND